MDQFPLIDWLMELPETLADAFSNEVAKDSAEKRMRFITTPERLAM